MQCAVAMLPALKMTQTELAARIGVSRLSVSDLIDEKRAMSPEMAVRIAMFVNTSAKSWLRIQEAVDLWALRQDSAKFDSVKPLNQARLDLAA